MIFQSSRRKFLAHLLHVLLAVQAKRSTRNNERTNGTFSPEEEERETRYIDGLGRAVEAADGEVSKLEYWSDMKRVQHSGLAGSENHRANEAEEKEWVAGHGCISHDEEVPHENPVEDEDNGDTNNIAKEENSDGQQEVENGGEKIISKKDKGKGRADS